MSRTTGPAAPTGGSGSIPGNSGEDTPGSGPNVVPASPPGSSSSPGDRGSDGSGGRTEPVGGGRRREDGGAWALTLRPPPTTRAQPHSSSIARATPRGSRGKDRERFLNLKEEPQQILSVDVVEVRARLAIDGRIESFDVPVDPSKDAAGLVRQPCPSMRDELIEDGTWYDERAVGYHQSRSSMISSRSSPSVAAKRLAEA